MLAAFQISLAVPISLKQAKQKAQNFWQQKGLRSEVVFVDVTPQDQYSGFYILNASDGNGFVLVSADTRAVSILGYSMEGSFNVDHMPAVVRQWLDGYEREIAMLRQSSDVDEPLSPEGCYRNPKNDTIVAPLLTTIWD